MRKFLYNSALSAISISVVNTGCMNTVDDDTYNYIFTLMREPDDRERISHAYFLQEVWKVRITIDYARTIAKQMQIFSRENCGRILF